MEPIAILIVDDEESLRLTMGQILQRDGYKVVMATDYYSGLQALEECKISAAVLDIHLPQISGVELLKAIAQREEYIPVIIMTGEPDITIVPEIIRAGAYDYLPKPIRRPELLRVVARAVEKKSLVEAKNRLEQELKDYAYNLERKVNERTQALQKTTNFLNTLLDSTNYAVIAWDPDGKISAYNRGAKSMFGYSGEEVIGKKSIREWPIFDAVDQAALDQICQATMSKGTIEREQCCLTQSGRRFDGRITMSPMRDGAGQVIGFLCLVKDITEEKKAAEDLNEMRRKLVNSEKIGALGRMSAHVAHEVKNPLGGLKLYALSLRKKVAESGGSDRLELADKICKSIDHLNDIVNGITKFAQPITLDRKRVRLNQVLEDALALLQHQILAKEIQVIKSLDENIPEGLFDESTLKSTFLNLIINATQAVERGGAIETKTALVARSDDAQAGNMVAVEIVDNGCGMTAEQRKNIFEPFFTTKNQGLGLGMTYVQNVVLLHHGSIQVNSQRGEGTRVRIVLPLSE